ncbi:VOC family protein [Nonomuraea sp. NPDC000554]|uniref:VOC family protein n=1 Tax=Nonomuraea sp. NPDC000554 TaxID=3154259 RepID=UPI003317DADE
MTLRIRYLMLRCNHPMELARFWSMVLDRPIDSGPNGCWIVLAPQGDPAAWLFVHHDHAHAPGNTHLSLRLNAPDGTLAEEVDRLVHLGARLVSSHERGRGLGWVTLADPEGNEFIVDSSDAEVAQAQAGEG